LISVLIHDRTDISPKLLESLRMEMIALLKKYMDIDESNIDISLDHGSRSVALVANVPVLRVKRGTSEASLSEASLSDSDSAGEARPAPRAEGSRGQNKNRRHR
jgi:cell division topological specificity factor